MQRTIKSIAGIVTCILQSHDSKVIRMSMCYLFDHPTRLTTNKLSLNKCIRFSDIDDYDRLYHLILLLPKLQKINLINNVIFHDNQLLIEFIFYCIDNGISLKFKYNLFPYLNVTFEIINSIVRRYVIEKISIDDRYVIIKVNPNVTIRIMSLISLKSLVP